MRILNVSALLDPVIGGGTAERTVQLSRAFSQAGMQTISLCMDTGFDRRALESRLGNARLEVLPCLNRRFLLPELNNSRIQALVDAVDVVHLCNHWTLLNVLVARIAKGSGKPWVACPSGALPIMGRSMALKRLYNLLAGRRLIQNAAACVAITARETLSFQEYGVDPRQVHVIPNGIEPGEYLEPDAQGFRLHHRLGSGPLLVFLGRLDPVKGPDLLLEAFLRIAARFPDWNLLFAGPDWGLAGALQLRAAGLAERVRFIGHVPLSDKSSLLSAASLVVVPSRSEAMSLVALEAGACGTPVLMTTECGFDDLPDSGGGDLVAASVEEIAKGIAGMLESGHLRDRGAKLRTYILAHYTWQAMVLEYESLFASILRNPAAA